MTRDEEFNDVSIRILQKNRRALKRYVGEYEDRSKAHCYNCEVRSGIHTVFRTHLLSDRKLSDGKIICFPKIIAPLNGAGEVVKPIYDESQFIPFLDADKIPSRGERIVGVFFRVHRPIEPEPSFMRPRAFYGRIEQVHIYDGLTAPYRRAVIYTGRPIAQVGEERFALLEYRGRDGEGPFQLVDNEDYGEEEGGFFRRRCEGVSRMTYGPKQPR